jgi:hypothetical protein
MNTKTNPLRLEAVKKITDLEVATAMGFHEVGYPGQRGKWYAFDVVNACRLPKFTTDVRAAILGCQLLKLDWRLELNQGEIKATVQARGIHYYAYSECGPEPAVTLCRAILGYLEDHKPPKLKDKKA